MTRLEQLQEFIREDPSDPFNHYALALEIARTDQVAALLKFKEIIHQFPLYLPTYYIAAKLLDESGNRDEALRLADNGIALARQSGDRKALAELNTLKSEIEF
ncbi:MAG: tetratricopeptide repeat protein [Bacteroidota bacterium]